jgi:hypothetical protein
MPHGRRIEVVAATPADAARVAFVSILGLSVAPPPAGQSGLPALAPLQLVAGTEAPTSVRAIQASRAAVLKAMAAALPPDGVVIAGPGEAVPVALAGWPVREFADWLADPARPAGLIPAGLDRVRLPPGADLTGRLVLAPVDGSARQFGAWQAAGAQVKLADPRPAPASATVRGGLDRIADAAARLLVEALAASGRDLTRTGFMRAVGDLRITATDWPTLDYRADPLTGTGAVALVAPR